jgi:prophage regulatory protein
VPGLRKLGQVLGLIPAHKQTAVFTHCLADTRLQNSYKRLHRSQHGELTTIKNELTSRSTRCTRLIPIHDAAKRVLYTTVHLARLVRENKFPKPVKLGQAPRSRIGFIESEIDDWIAAHAARREVNNRNRE